MKQRSVTIYIANGLPTLCHFLSANGLAEAEIAAANQRILANLDLPDGRPFIAKRCWMELLDEVRDFHFICGRENKKAAMETLDAFKEDWRRVHDRDVDHCYGLLNEVKVRFGEVSVEEALRAIVLPIFTWRYSKFDIDKHPWEVHRQGPGVGGPLL